jgi:hypothetical protein
VGSGVFGEGYHQFAWDGRDDSGRIVPDGTYRVQLTLKDENRTIEFPQTITVDSTPPTIEVALRHQVFSPDGDGRADHFDFVYRFGEPAWGILYVDEKRVGKTYRKKPNGRYPWYGKRKKPGDYRLALGAQDLAGNQTSTREFTVRLRYVELFRKRFRPRAGRVLRVRVSSDAETLTWRLGSRSGTGKPPVLKIPVPSQPGRYTLTVRANGHRARATVVVRR